MVSPYTLNQRNEMKLKSNQEIIKVGAIGVDAGLVWLGDPCYILHPNKMPKALGKDWGEFCDTLKYNGPTVQSYNYDMGHEGLGVVVSSGFGDGTYPVYALMENVDGWGKRIKKVWIDFFTDEDENDE